MSPRNQEWPGSACIYGESKDYQDAIGLDTIKSILAQISEKAKLEIAFTREMQGEYFIGQEKFQDVFGDGTKASKMVYFKIYAATPKTKLERINGLPLTGLKKGLVSLFFVETSAQVNSKWLFFTLSKPHYCIMNVILVRMILINK